MSNIETNPVTARIHRGGPPKSNVNARKHGLNSARRVLNTFGLRALDGRSRLGVALRAFRNEIVKDLGGEAGLSAQRRAVLDVVIREKLLLDSIDAYVLSRPSLIVRQRKALLPVVKERQAIADSFIRNLQILGLDRIKPPAPTLADILAKHNSEKAAATPATQQPSAGSIAAQRPASQEILRVPAAPTSAKVAPVAITLPEEDPTADPYIDDFGNPIEPDPPKLFICIHCKSEFFAQQPEQKCRWCQQRVVRKEPA